MPALPFDVAARPDYRTELKQELAAMEALFADYRAALERRYTVPAVPDPK